MSGRDLRKFVNFHRTAIGAAGRDQITKLLNDFQRSAAALNEIISLCIFTLFFMISLFGGYFKSFVMYTLILIHLFV